MTASCWIDRRASWHSPSCREQHSPHLGDYTRRKPIEVGEHPYFVDSVENDGFIALGQATGLQRPLIGGIRSLLARQLVQHLVGDIGGKLHDLGDTLFLAEHIHPSDIPFINRTHASIHPHFISIYATRDKNCRHSSLKN